MFYFSIHLLLFKSIARRKSSFKTHIDVFLVCRCLYFHVTRRSPAKQWIPQIIKQIVNISLSCLLQHDVVHSHRCVVLASAEIKHKHQSLRSTESQF